MRSIILFISFFLFIGCSSLRKTPETPLYRAVNGFVIDKNNNTAFTYSLGFVKDDKGNVAYTYNLGFVKDVDGNVKYTYALGFVKDGKGEVVCTYQEQN